MKFAILRQGVRREPQLRDTFSKHLHMAPCYIIWGKNMVSGHTGNPMVSRLAKVYKGTKIPGGARTLPKLNNSFANAWDL